MIVQEDGTPIGQWCPISGYHVRSDYTCVSQHVQLDSSSRVCGTLWLGLRSAGEGLGERARAFFLSSPPISVMCGLDTHRCGGCNTSQFFHDHIQ